MKSLSKYRRHKFAGPVLVLVALMTTGTAFTFASALPNTTSTVASVTSTQIEEGKRLFAAGCSSCHGLNAEGSKIAPSLIGVGAEIGRAHV